MTGDINQRNNSTMFGFENTYPNASTFPRFSDEAAAANPFPANRIENSFEGAFSNNSSSLDINSDHVTQSSMIYPTNYLLPSTSALHNVTPNNFQIPSTEISTTINNATNFQQSYGNTQIPMPYMYNQFNWCQNYVPSNTFSSNTTNSFSSKPFADTFGCKRKTETQSFVPIKQHITEERMAEHMSRLHISSQTPSSKESEPLRERRLYMCEEMQRLQTESIIPAQILEKMNRPCTALVPWRPLIVPPLSTENNNDEDEPNNMKTQSENDVEMDL